MEWRIYIQQWQEVVDKRKRAVEATENESSLSNARMNAGINTMVSRGTSLLASTINKARLKPSDANKASNKRDVVCVQPVFRMSDLTDDSEMMVTSLKTASKPPRSQVQTLLVNNHI